MQKGEALYFINPLSDEALKSRKIPQPSDARGPYLRDKTVIMHSRHFRRLAHKTQLIFDPANDHLCTRMEHCLHVATIAESICTYFGLDSTLAQAISFGHDLGHSPFGHVGEKVFSQITGIDFQHAIHSLRVVDCLENFGKGLNLTYAVRDGIVSHSGGKNKKSIEVAETPNNLGILAKSPKNPSSWEACVVKLADDVAYLGRDIEDGIMAGLITLDDVPERVRKLFGDEFYEYNRLVSKMFLNDIIEETEKTGKIGLTDEKFELSMELRGFIKTALRRNSEMDVWEKYVKLVVQSLYEFYGDLFSKRSYDFDFYMKSNLDLERTFGFHIKPLQDSYIASSAEPATIITDYLAGMTDRYAIECFRRILYDQSSGFK